MGYLADVEKRVVPEVVLEDGQEAALLDDLVRRVVQLVRQDVVQDALRRKTRSANQSKKKKKPL
jgi:hypothetical protein